ncbi:transportin-3-like isoform X1 [Amphibalanus amphitrite]|uniref:transportin-3-like isoform X1 n=1 Tax=Amphibalanus amphitrite TaxID=1232801 RepID=UPI001C8FD0AC|nr:transportin-3-like isoform X1 [Amphibalanus amphitrite]XP_043242942.1 transportin-3-like isoform X1 [Amphibalanus amphitrite]
MENPPTTELVVQAIQTLYHDPNPTSKEQASKWLQELQQSIVAWKVADQLLHDKRDLESCYFAAQTMRTKIQYSFHELPPEAHGSLRESLLEHMACITAGTSQIIVTQLCLSVADLALLMSSWLTPVEDLVARFGDSHPVPLLEVLTVLPEEVGSRHLRLGANRRDQVTAYCTRTCPLVLNLLNGSVSATEPTLQTKLLRCLSSWFTFPADALVQVADSDLLKFTFQVLHNHRASDSLHEVATDCVCSALFLIEEDLKYQPLAKALFTGAFTLAEPYQLAVAEELIDKCRNYSRIFTELGEAVVTVIVNNPGHGLGSLQVLDMILVCVGHHDYEVAEVTFHFWYRLSEELYQQKSSDQNARFKPYFERLLLALCRHCQMESDHDGTPDDQDDFNDFRARVADLVRDFVFVCGSLDVFHQMYLFLQAAGAPWESSEAALFIMATVAKNILPKQDSVVPEVVQAVLALSDNVHLALRYTAINLLNGLAEWIGEHPSVLEPVLNFLLVGLRVAKLATVSARALRSICAQCDRQMTGHLSGLVQIVQALDTFNITSDAAVGILEGTAKVVANMPPEAIPEMISKICQPLLGPLQQTVDQAGDSRPAKGSRSDPVLWLDRLAAVFRHTHPEVSNGQIHPCKAVFEEQVWPVLSAVMRRFQRDGRVMERCCRCLRFAVRCVGAQSAPLLQPMTAQMVEIYATTQHSCLIYLASVIVDEYAAQPECVPPLLGTLHALLPAALPLLAGPDGLRQHPETVDDLFRLCTRLVQRVTLPFLRHPQTRDVTRLAVSAVTLDHRDANASVTKYLSELLRWGRKYEERDDFDERRQLVAAAFAEFGAALVGNLIQATLFCVASFMIPDIGEVFMEALLTDRPSVCRWLEATLKSLPTESAGGIVTATHKQLVEFHKAVTSAETTQDAVRALREFSRLYR